MVPTVRESQEFKEVSESQGKWRGSGDKSGNFKSTGLQKTRQMTKLFKMIKTYTSVVIKLIIPSTVFSACRP